MKLQTVAELHNKLSDFEQANNDMKNLLNSTENRNTVSRQRVKHTQVWSRNENIKSDAGGLDLVNDLNYPDMEGCTRRN
jgi:two-component system CheB/CheR fusion protein